MGWLEAWGKDLIEAMEALQTVAAQCMAQLEVAQQKEECMILGATCLAYQDSGALCRAPASILDR